jgi:hypothetical protein
MCVDYRSLNDVTIKNKYPFLGLRICLIKWEVPKCSPRLTYVQGIMS